MYVLGDVDVVPEERFELLLELDLVDQTASALEGDEQVDVTRWSPLAPRPSPLATEP